MLDEAQALPDDIAALKAMVLASQAELRNRDLLIEKLKHQLAGLRRQRFGATSEALDQLELGIEDEEIAQAAEAVPEPMGRQAEDRTHGPLLACLPDGAKKSLARRAWARNRIEAAARSRHTPRMARPKRLRDTN